MEQNKQLTVTSTSAKDKIAKLAYSNLVVCKNKGMDPTDKNIQQCCGSLAAIGLNVGLGEGFVVPYGQTFQVQIGYLGFIQLALRTGQYIKLGVNCVYDTDIKTIDEFGDVDIKFNEITQASKVVGFLAYFKLTNGFVKKLYMSEMQAKAHGAKYSKSGKSGLWASEFETMAKKTVIKLLISKWGVKSTELENALKMDQAVLENDKFMYSDNPGNPKGIAQIDDKIIQKAKKIINNVEPEKVNIDNVEEI